MHKRFSVLLLVLALVLGITSFQLVWAKNGTTSIDLTPILATAKTSIDAMPASDQAKTKLLGLVADELQNAVKKGFTLGQTEGLANQMVMLAALVDLESNLQSLKACYQLMIKAMQDGATAYDIGGLIAANLAAGADPKDAARQAIKNGEEVVIGDPC